MLCRIKIWGIWRPRQHLDLFIMFVKPFLNDFCSVAGCIILLKEATTIREYHCHQEDLLCEDVLISRLVSFCIAYLFSVCACLTIYIKKMALLCWEAKQVALLRLCFYLLFYSLLLSLFTHITPALITNDKGTLLDIGQRYTNQFPDTLSSNPSWPLEILRKAEENNGHLNNPPRRWIKKHCGKHAGIHNRLRKRAHSPPLLSILLTNVQSLENKMDDLRTRISFKTGHKGL